jgi:uncharacterized membrane-anchored protein YhcB (DUF1043 family)
MAANTQYLSFIEHVALTSVSLLAAIVEQPNHLILWLKALAVTANSYNLCQAPPRDLCLGGSFYSP